MAIFRVEHNKNYTVVNNTICTDKRLSWKAKGIWLYAFSRPDNWSFSQESLTMVSTDGIDSVRSGLKELEEAGYLVRSRVRGENGQLGDAEWVFYETPQTIQKSLPKLENPMLDNPIQEKPTLLSTDIPSTDRKESVAAAPPGILVKKGKAGEIRVDESDILRQLMMEKLNFQADQFKQAWKILAEYGGVIYDAYLFVKQTLENIITKQKSENIRKAQTCSSPNNSSSKSKNTQPNGSTTTSEDVMPMPARVSLTDLLNSSKEGWSGFEYLRTS